MQGAAAAAGPNITQLAQALDALLKDEGRVGDLSILLAADRQHQQQQQPAYRPHPPGVRCIPRQLCPAGRRSPAPCLTRAPPQSLPLLEFLAHQPVPQVVLERLNTRQVSSYCGLFPEIGRVWCAIDNVLFIWRYDAECVPRRARRQHPPPRARRMARSGTFRAAGSAAFASCGSHARLSPAARGRWSTRRTSQSS